MRWNFSPDFSLVSNRDSHSHSPFELDRRSILRKYYIANMRDGALANNYKKLLKE